MNNLAIIGLATMGKNLAKNFASKGKQVAVFNRTYLRTEELISEQVIGIIGYQELSECIKSLEIPRVVVVLVKAGEAVDHTIEQLLPLLSANDTIIEMGNSHFRDTLARQTLCKKNNIYLIGCGISGGEEGALYGPSLMPSGDKTAMSHILPLLELIAAKDFNGNPCVTNLGAEGSGHFVKMIHNGIEYAMMQGIAEVYDMMRFLGIEHEDQVEFFNTANSGSTTSYLLEITTKVLKRMEQGIPFIDQIVDVAGSKGTGKWTVQTALELDVAIPTISAALMARMMSSRAQALKPLVIDLEHEIESIHPTLFTQQFVTSTLHGIFVTSYLQGLEIILAANKQYDWNIDLKEVLRIWQGGCIIRSQVLTELNGIFDSPVALQNLYTDTLEEISSAVRVLASLSGDMPRPIVHASYDYVVALLSETLPTNFIQGLRDYFGAHGFELKDKPGSYTGGWYPGRPMTKME
jgi:6-phosphogluconate dehydrogenase